MTTVVYTDGACLGNPGPGGWAWAVRDGPFASGSEPHSTNQRMEIKAALEAVRSLEGPLEVVSDSTYVVNCFRDRWWEGWLARGWLNKAKKPVRNRDLWEPLIDAYRADPQRVRFTWVKGHSEDPMNDLVDRLAVEAAQKQAGRTGTGHPVDLGPADPAGREDRDGRVPEGHRLVVAGMRPPELGGYDDNPVADGVRAELTEILAAKREMHDDLVVLTGLGLGTEQLGAEAAAAAGVPYVGVLPYPDPDAVWPDASRDRYARLLAGARDQVLLQTRRPETKQAAGAALARRDAWLARHADEAVAVWDGEDARTARQVRSLQDHLGDDVWVVSPAASA
jgi:ribonuclease HI/uncharacterized phage-like protein YoqJ